MVNCYVMKLELEVFIDCLPYEWQSGTSDGLFLPIYPPRSMRVVLWFLMACRFLQLVCGFFMANVESMDYTHSHLSTIAILFGTMHCPFSHRELVQTSPVHPNPVIWYALSHINLLISSSKQHHTYLLWHFHSHSEINCHATFHHFVQHDTFIIIILLSMIM